MNRAASDSTFVVGNIILSSEQNSGCSSPDEGNSIPRKGWLTFDRWYTPGVASVANTPIVSRIREHIHDPPNGTVGVVQKSMYRGVVVLFSEATYVN